MSSTSSDLAAGVAAFAMRLATRDQPAVLLFDRASVEQRIAAGITARFPALHQLTYFRLTFLLYSFLEEPQQQIATLADEFNLSASALRRIVRPLLAEGLVARIDQAADARQKTLCLTRAGEDWLQTLVQAPNPL